MTGTGSSIGRPIDRVDGLLKVTGQARYAVDVSIDGLAHAVLVRSTSTKGRVTEVDTAAAEAAPGVIAVLTHHNAPRLPYAEPPPGQRGRHLSGEPETGHYLRMLQDDRVHFNGQPVAIVVAESWEQARHAASLVSLAYAAESHTTRLEDALAEAREPAAAGRRAPPPKGAPDQALEAATVRVDERYSTPMEHHNPIGLFTTVARWDGARLTVHDTTQGVYGVREHLALVFGMDPADVRVISPFTGGAFGAMLRTWPHVVAAAMAARVVGRPVKLVLSRSDIYTLCGHRPETHHRMRLGATGDGRLQALLHDAWSSTSRYEEFAEGEVRLSRLLYTCPNVSTTYRLVPLDVSTPIHMRAPGEATGSFPLESAMDELAYALGLDPLELRLQNYAELDPDRNLPWSSNALRECYRVGAERIGWSRRMPRPGSLREGRFLIGLGMATGCYPAFRAQAAARARLLAGGSAVIQTSATDIGPASYTMLAQVAADTLGLEPAQVRVELGDSALPASPPQGGSQIAASAGSAVFAACQAVLALLRAIPGADEVPFAEVLERHGLSELEAVGEYRPGDEVARYSSHAFGARFAEVRVDPDTCEVRVSRFVSTQAAGRIVNPKTARSQMLGSTVMGIGMALMERTTMDHRYGRIVNQNIGEYLVPVAADVPDIEVVLVEEDDPHVDPIGVKGIAEVGLVGVAAAIANAVFHATGIRIRDLPITPDKLLLTR
jgi:xanthine dehydrogenase YagR molybdenum-binding subunit